jgi:hypothetical protein
MKIMVNDKLYVQVKDISFIIHVFPFISSICPKKVLTKFFDKVLICNDNNKYTFMEFSDIEEINFFKNLNFIVDYDTYKDLTFKEIIRNVENIGNSLNDIVDRYNELDEVKQEENKKKFTYLFETKYYKMNSIREIYKIKSGELKIDLPIEDNIEVEKGIKKYFKIFFKK